LLKNFNKKGGIDFKKGEEFHIIRHASEVFFLRRWDIILITGTKIDHWQEYLIIIYG
jgi:hypothetical protein